MSKHKSEDYKLSAVKYYLNNDVSLDDVCEIFDCPKQSLYLFLIILCNSSIVICSFSFNFCIAYLTCSFVSL